MTRAERLAEQVQKAKDKLAAEAQRAKARLAEQRQAVSQAEAMVQADARKALTRRRYSVGYLAERHGLFAWSDADLDVMFEALAFLVPCPNPAALLEGLLAGAPVDGGDISLAAPDVARGVSCTNHVEPSPTSPLSHLAAI
jgi:hypothetical protein